MADIIITPDAWTAVAEGAGSATFEALDRDARWFVGAETPATSGFTAPPNRAVSLALQEGETLYLRGRGTVVVLADNVPA